MATKEPVPSPSERVSASYKQLFAAAAGLNTVSDALGKSISALDNALKKLNLGISTWVKVKEWHDQSGEWYSNHKLGYAKIGNKWGIGLATEEGSYNYPDDEKSEAWLFNEAPRSLRIEAVEKIPDLLAQLTKETETTTQKLAAKVSEAEELADTINQVVSELNPPKKPGGPR